MGLGHEFFGVAGGHDATALNHIGTLRHIQGQGGILFNQLNGHATGMNLPNGFKHLLCHRRGQAQ